MQQQVILVDSQDQQIGVADKLLAHQQGWLHRAFSVFIFGDQQHQQILLQRRADDKYHCGGLWSNACCSHPRDGESILQAAKRRLPEELGFSTELSMVTSFIYQVELANQLIEHEYDHLLLGYAGQLPINFNRQEVSAVKWIEVSDLLNDLQHNSENYTPWLAKGLELLLAANV